MNFESQALFNVASFAYCLAIGDAVAFALTTGPVRST